MKKSRKKYSYWYRLLILFLLFFACCASTHAKKEQKFSQTKEPLVFQVEPKMQPELPAETGQTTDKTNAISKTEAEDEYKGCLSYLTRLDMAIKKNWKAEESETRKVVLFFTLSRNGEVSGLRVMESSGSKEYDDKAMEAVRKATIPHFPKSAPPTADFSFTFQSPPLIPLPQKLRRF